MNAPLTLLTTGLSTAFNPHCGTFVRLHAVFNKTKMPLRRRELPYSNGTVEGHVNRLKFVKRQMFGRAKFDLLRLRVLA